MGRRLVGAAVLVASLVLTLAGCGADPTTAAGTGDDRLDVVTTVAPITSIVANIAGERARVTGVVPEGSDSHTFEPRPSDAETLSRADIIFVNGLQLEEPTVALAERTKRSDTEIVALGDLTVSPDDYIFDFSFPEEEGRPNPHLWTNPPMARNYAGIVADHLADLDPEGADYYRANLERFSAKVDELDAAVREASDTVPRERRKLLTYHDSWPYFARDYDWEVIGAIQMSDFGDPTPREVARLIEQVKAAGVPAIFGSEVFPSPVLAQIAREAGVEYRDDLRDDDLPGRPGDPEHSWLGMMRFNFVVMVETLGGDATALRALDVSDVVPDTATYPQ